jgi:hypothetical protein
MLYEGARHREIFLDGRPLPKDLDPAWSGYSVGRWEGDDLVVDSAGFNDKPWIDINGHPTTSQQPRACHTLIAASRSREPSRRVGPDCGLIDEALGLLDGRAVSYFRTSSIKASARVSLLCPNQNTACFRTSGLGLMRAT